MQPVTFIIQKPNHSLFKNQTNLKVKMAVTINPKKGKPNSRNPRVCKQKWCLSVIEHGKTEHAQMLLVRFSVEPNERTKVTIVTSFENEDVI